MIKSQSMQDLRKKAGDALDQRVRAIMAGVGLTELRALMRGDPPTEKPKPRYKVHTTSFLFHIRPRYYEAGSTILTHTFRLGFSMPSELSRGMKQKLATACGLVHAPRVIYFDEPLTGLDPIGIRRMKDSILKRARDGAAIMISSHLLHLVEEICSHILILKNGRKVIDGTIAEITQKFSQQPGDANLEEVFFRATSDVPAPPLPSAVLERRKP